MKGNQKPVRIIFIILSVLAVASCGGHNIVPNRIVDGVPDGKYARMIKLDNPDGQPDRTLAGLVQMTGHTTICTDYPRETVINSIDDLSFMEKKAFPFFKNYVIEEGLETIGYVSIPLDYRIVIWRRHQDPQCRYKAAIIIPEHSAGFFAPATVVPGISAW